MVANRPREQPGGDGTDYLLNRLDALERRVAELSSQSKFPFMVSSNGNKEFSVEPSEDGVSTDLIIGNGIGGKAFETYTSVTYGGKGWVLYDYDGTPVFSSDTSAGYGVGVPSFPFSYGGYPEILNMNGATTAGTATQVAEGSGRLINPALWIQPRARVSSGTANTVKMFAKVSVASGTYTTSERTINVNNSTVAAIPEFAWLLTADDMDQNCDLSIWAYCSAGTPANVTVQCTYHRGLGISKAFFDQSLQAAI